MKMIKEKVREWDRVIKLSRKPTKSEYIMVAKITGLGIVIIGAIGFLIRIAIQLTGVIL
jgi:protein transport protein SEC61 subunit gamma-like protein